MPTIAGPNVQPPAAGSTWFDIVQDERGRIISITPTFAAMQFFHAAQELVYNMSRSGPTGSRPTSTLSNRFVGLPFFDTTLGLPVFLKTASSSAWVKADGTPA